jgi:hypothetical protein
VLYEWLDSGEPVGLESGVSLAQYDLVNITINTQDNKDQIRVRRGNVEQIVSLILNFSVELTIFAFWFPS